MIDWIVTSSLLIIIIIALRAILKGRISLRLQYGLWLLVLIRLLIPLNLPSQLSVLNLLPEEDGQALEQPLTYVAYDPQSLPDLARPEVNYDLPAEQQQPQYEQALQEYEQTINEAKAQTGIAVTWKGVLYTLWILGMIAMTVLLLVSNLRFDRQLKKTAKSAVTMGCHLPTYFSDVVATPCLFGLFKPRIYLTAEAASRMDVMQYVLTHELAHYQHKDHIWSVLRALCLVLHWYNPLVWAAAILSKQDAELCCDETAIKFLGEHQRQSYGKALIDMSCVKKDVKSLLITATTMVGSKKALKERILLIAKHPRTAVYTLILVILVAAIAVGCTFTGQQTEPADTTPSTEPSSETTNPTEPAPTGYPEGEIQFTLAYINGQPYIHDSTWMPGGSLPSGYLRDGSILTEDNKNVPTTERAACHLAPGTPIYTNAEDDTYIFYWSIPQEENHPRRMIRLDQTSFQIDNLQSDPPPTAYTKENLQDSLLNLNGLLYVPDPHMDLVSERPNDYVYYGSVQSTVETEAPSQNLQSRVLPEGTEVYTGPYVPTRIYCKVQTTEGSKYLSMLAESYDALISSKADSLAQGKPQPLPGKYDLDTLVTTTVSQGFEWMDQSGRQQTYYFSLPEFYPFSQEAIDINAQIIATFMPYLEEVRQSYVNGPSRNTSRIHYSAALQDDILSVVIHEETMIDLTRYHTYNFDLTTGKLLDRDELLDKLQISRQQFLTAAAETAKAVYIQQWGYHEPGENEFYDQQYSATLREDNLLDSQLYLDSRGNLVMVLKLVPLAGASYYPTPIILPI